MRTLEFIRGGLEFDLLVAKRVPEILPMLRNAAAGVSETQKQTLVEPERL